MKIIAIIPARSGSKGLPNKNIMELCGKPLIAYSVEAALRAEVFEEIMVSTDSEEYADVAKEYGAEVPFLRSKKNSSDNASSWDTVYEVISHYHEINREFDAFVLLQPTSPLRDERDIRGAIEEYNEKKANTIVSVCEAEYTPTYMNILPESLSMESFFEDHKWARRQDLPKYYRLNGAIYMSDVKSFMSYRDVYKGRCYAYIMNTTNSIDIDSYLDFLYAEAVLKYRDRTL